jgi:response regulator RpfG family c-di-GMP phosphodiesterase
MATEVVLVVEDDSKSRKLVRDLLAFKGCEITEAETGEEGVGLATATPRVATLLAGSTLNHPEDIIGSEDEVAKLRKQRLETHMRGVVAGSALTRRYPAGTPHVSRRP